jgi:DnaJ family protein A protein 2
MVTRIAQLGPGMISQMSSPCGACRGTGRVIPEERRCRKCGGKKVAPERKIVEVHIEPGMRHGSRITFRGEAGDEPGAEPGDLIFVVQQKPHAVFKRDGNDLFLEREIPLADALCGVQFALTHLDKRRLRIASAAGEVIAPGTFKCVENGACCFVLGCAARGPLVDVTRGRPPSVCVSPAGRVQMC